ncbi:MAG: epoxide hydrolase [Burkholderiaceae bacterium]|nr:epoxide hydrolase [Burkholderiaceae bacterium]
MPVIMDSLTQRMMPHRYSVAVPQDCLDDLQERLRRTRWPVEPQGNPWRYGASLNYLRRVVAYWSEHFDWRRSEAALNRFQNYLVSLDGLAVHCIVEPGSGPNPRPLVLTHGWPGSIVEFLHVIEPLAHPERFGGRVEDAFTVVVPSIPGYGFSQAPLAPITPRQVGHLWHQLMTQVLGFPRFFAQGGDWGSIISSWMAYDHPDAVEALHINLLGFIDQPAPEQQTPEERDWFARNAAWRQPEDGYRIQQGTRPQTLAYGLTDSPVGLAAWVLEKFHGWTVPGETRDPPFALDDLLANVMMYWIPGPNAASWYYISILEQGARRLPPGERVNVPTGVLICPRDTNPPQPTSLIERSYRLVRRTDAQEGGHFLALEQPTLFVKDVREFFRAFR